MIISRTPLRISFFGGGTDYPAWYLAEGGAVLSTTIDKFCYITCRQLPPFFHGLKHRIVWRHVETVQSLSDILHPAIREGLRFLGFDDSIGMEIHYQGDLPARSGMGSSSAFAAGLIKALISQRGQTISRHDLALKAIELEQQVLKENVGSQDQMAVAYGGLNVIRFHRDGQIVVEPVIIHPSRKSDLQSRLLLFYTGMSRSASNIAADVIANLSAKREIMRQMHAYVDEALSIVCGTGSLDDFGRLLHQTWILKKQQSELVTNPLIDHLYRLALEQGALGGKLLGAGSSGFMVFYVPPEHQSAVIRAFSEYLHVPFTFDNEGCTLLQYGINPIKDA